MTETVDVSLRATRLGRDFFDRSTTQVARELLGKILVHGDKRAVITETEAYLAKDDLAAHSVQGRKAALAALAKGPGTVYMHQIHAWTCMDVVAGDGSVLLRGVDLAKADGPGKLCMALGLTKTLHLRNVADPDCPVQMLDAPLLDVIISKRVGISQAADKLLRFKVQTS